MVDFFILQFTMDYNSRFTVFTIVQNWIFEENLALYIENQRYEQRLLDRNLELVGMSAMIDDLGHQLRVADANLVAMQLRIQHAENRAREYHDRYIGMFGCDCDECIHQRRTSEYLANYPTDVERDDEETDSDPFEIEDDDF